MQFGVVVPSYGPFGDAAAIRDVIDAAEGLGYDTAWFGDHIVIPHYAAHVSAPRWFDALACCIFGAGRTWRLRFGTDVLVLPYRHPVVLSQLVASADQLCDGRLTLGVGVGYIRGEFDAVAAAPYGERGAVTDEYLEVLRLLWDSDGPVSHTGPYVQFQDVVAAPEPQQRPFPLWVGGNKARALRRAAQYGTGWHPLYPTPEGYAEGRATIAAHRAELGRHDPFTFAFSCPETRVIMDDRDVRPSVSYEGLADIPSEYSYAPPFPKDGAGRARFVGTPDDLVEDVTAYAAAGVEHLALRFWTGDPGVGVDDVVRQLERFVQEVAPAFV
jgi:probable F420-dependent oxidoreductase